MTLGYITLLLQFLCNFSRVQVVLHELEATKRLILYAGASGKSCYDMKHRTTICKLFWDILSRKKSDYDLLTSYYDLESASGQICI
jgi:hypothetical protein